MATPRTKTPRSIKPKFGLSLLFLVFGDKPFVPCLIELIKNGFDWYADHVHIFTDDRTKLRIFDDGHGMNEDNRNACLSMGDESVKRDPTQSGKFDTGLKHFLFSYALSLHVLTAPKDERGLVYSFTITPEELSKIALSGGSIIPDIMQKNDQTWPHGTDSGTELTFTLRNPRSRSITRGAKLATRLAARLSTEFKDKLSVDTAPLPDKVVVGEIYRSDIQHDELGVVNMEIYRPEKRLAEEKLRMTGRVIGEATIDSMFRACSDMPIDFPTLFLRRDVCGVISTPFLNDYAIEKRDEINPAVADDARTMHLIRLLKRYEKEIARKLKINLHREDDIDEAVVDGIQDIADLCRHAYDPEGNRSKGDGPGKGKGRENDPPTSTPPVLTLKYRKEVELDEEFEIRARIRKDKLSQFGLDQLVWRHTQSRAKVLDDKDDHMLFKAIELGRALVMVDLRGTGILRRAHYQVVPERFFRIEPQDVEVSINEPVSIFAVNRDKLAGEVVWRHEGVGKIDIKGPRVIFTSEVRGDATVIASDSESPGVLATSRIHVRGEEVDKIVIREHEFRYQHLKIGGKRPVNMIAGGQTHMMHFDIHAPGYEKALRGGPDVYRFFLAQSMAVEYARFARLVLNPPSSVDVRDLAQLTDEINGLAYEVFKEILEGGKSK